MKSESAPPSASLSAVPFLRAAQNEDGGWGFRPRAQSRVESTCWALKALDQASPPTSSWAADGEHVERGLKYLVSAQLADGSWPAMPGEQTGSWVTSLACWTLAGLDARKHHKPIAAGLRWVCDDWPKDSSWLQKTLRRLSSAKKLSKQNDTYRGWGWTPHTSSWVEPTSFAMLALEHGGAIGLAKAAEKRRALGEILLYDRMVAGGGWNCGNPEVYGVAGEPLVIPTAWALVALRKHPERRENVESLSWMERNYSHIQAPASAALARICLSVYRLEVPGAPPPAAELSSAEESLNSVQVAAWALIADNGAKNLFGAGGEMR